MPSYDRRDAAKFYAQHSAELHHLLKEIDKYLAVHDRDAAKDPKNWGYVGDLETAIERAKGVLHWVGGPGGEE